MNSELKPENSAPTTLGARLSSAREQMGLTQQNVAERLCLKISIVKALEEDNIPTDLASTFLRGYIRSYGRLVGISDKELQPILAQQSHFTAPLINSTQNLPLNHKQKKRDGWLLMFTLLVLLVLVGLTGAWWWQNHRATQNDLLSLAEQSQYREQPEAAMEHSDIQHDTDETVQDAGVAEDIAPPPLSLNSDTTDHVTEPTDNAYSIKAGDSPSTPLPNPQAVPTPTPMEQPHPLANTSVDAINASVPDSTNASTDSNSIAIQFKASCWLEVIDGTGKKLFSGQRASGDSLTLTGVAPYSLKIGAPAAVAIYYQSKRVDLSEFIRSKKVARIVLDKS